MSPVADSPMKVVPSIEPSSKKLRSDPLLDVPIKLQIAKLSENATIPTRGSARAAGYDLYSAEVRILSTNYYISSLPSPRTPKFLPEARDSSKLISRLKCPAEPTAELHPGLASLGKTTSTSVPEWWTRITGEMLVSSFSSFFYFSLQL